MLKCSRSSITRPLCIGRPQCSQASTSANTGIVEEVGCRTHGSQSDSPSRVDDYFSRWNASRSSPPPFCSPARYNMIVSSSKRQAQLMTSIARVRRAENLLLDLNLPGFEPTPSRTGVRDAHHYATRSPCAALHRRLPPTSTSTGTGAGFTHLPRRSLHTTPKCRYDDYLNKLYLPRGKKPVKRTIETSKLEWRRFQERAHEAEMDVYRRKGILTYPVRKMLDRELLPWECSFLIIGGGIMGSSVAFWLKQRFRDELNKVVVVERDDTFAQSSSILGVGGIRTQFSVPESVKMSVFSAEFLRHAGEHLQITNNPKPDIEFTPMGHLFLATTEEQATQMERDHKVQLENGAKVKLMSPDELREMYPFMDVSDVRVASIGLQNEGIFDSWSLLSALREKNLALGVQYIKAQVTGFLFVNKVDGIDETTPEDEMWRFRTVRGAVVKPEKSAAAPRPIHFMTCVNAAGPWAGRVAQLAGCGIGPELLSVPVSIEPRKRHVFSFFCEDGPGLDMPFLIEPNGVWARREGVTGLTYYCGKELTDEEDRAADHTSLTVDDALFEEVIKPTLVKRIPGFKSMQRKNAWAGYHDVNTFDRNPIVGPHPFFGNFIQLAGFGGTGLQHAMAAGRGVMESCYDGAYIGVDLNSLEMDRLMNYRELHETIRV